MGRSSQIVLVVSSTVYPCHFFFQTCSSAIATSILYEERVSCTKLTFVIYYVFIREGL